MMVAHKIALDPNNTQRSYFARASGTARSAYNWALGEWKKQYQAGGKPSEVCLRRHLNALKREQYPWMFDVTKCAVQEAIIDLGAAFRAFFEKRGAYPRFKKRGVHDGFCAANETGTFRCEASRIKLPLIGWVKMREAVRFSGVLKRVTISREADRWFAAILVDTADIQPVAQPQQAIGIDLGVSVLATPSQGEAISGPKAHTALLKRLRRTSRAFCCKQRGSRRAAKARLRLSQLVKTYRRIGIEDLNVRAMVRNRHLARSIMDGGFHEFRRQLDYKARFYGAVVVVADRWFPSSKTCSCCGLVKAGLALSQRRFRCFECGFESGRDLNAAPNLERLAASSAVSACGEESSSVARNSRVKRTSMKREPNGEAELCVA
jgi:putative transposase